MGLNRFGIHPGPFGNGGLRFSPGGSVSLLTEIELLAGSGALQLVLNLQLFRLSS